MNGRMDRRKYKSDIDILLHQIGKLQTFFAQCAQNESNKVASSREKIATA